MLCYYPITPFVGSWQEATRSWGLLLNIGDTAPVAFGMLGVVPCICLRLRDVGNTTTVAVGVLIVAVTRVTAFVFLVHMVDAAAGADDGIFVGLGALHLDRLRRRFGENIGLESHYSECESLRKSHLDWWFKRRSR